MQVLAVFTVPIRPRCIRKNESTCEGHYINDIVLYEHMQVLTVFTVPRYKTDASENKRVRVNIISQILYEHMQVLGRE